MAIWYNTSATERKEIRYFLTTYENNVDEMYLAREVIENPTTNPKRVYCESYGAQKNCSPESIVPYASDFQVVFKNANGNPLSPVCANKASVSQAAPSTPSCSTAGIAE